VKGEPTGGPGRLRVVAKARGKGLKKGWGKNTGIDYRGTGELYNCHHGELAGKDVEPSKPS